MCQNYASTEPMLPAHIGPVHTQFWHIHGMFTKIRFTITYLMTYPAKMISFDNDIFDNHPHIQLMIWPKIAFDGCVCWLSFKWCILLTWECAILFFNSLAPGKCEWNFRHVIFKQILMNDGWGISREISLISIRNNNTGQACYVAEAIRHNNIVMTYWIEAMPDSFQRLAHTTSWLGCTLLTHCGRVTPYGDGSMLCKNPIFFTTKEFPQI